LLRQRLGPPWSGLGLTVFVFVAAGAAAPAARPAAPPAAAAQPPAVMGYPQAAAAAANQAQQAQQQAAAAAAVAAAAAAAAAAGQHAAQRREQTNDYAALFVALIGAARPRPSGVHAVPGCWSYPSRLRRRRARLTAPARGAPGESDAPQGVVNTTDGRVVRAFHRFTLVDQTGQGRDLTKGRRRDQGAVKISCARQARAARPPAACCPLTGRALRSRLPAPGPHAVAARPQDPNARNCHGYRKFVKRSVLENPSSGYLVADTIIIKYTIELVVSSGGALARAPGVSLPKLPTIQVGTRAALAGVGCGERGPAT